MNKAKKYVYAAISIVVWLLIWEIGARIFNKPAFFSGAVDTFAALGGLVLQGNFWKTVMLSVLRIILGFFIGIVFAIILAFLSIKIPFFRSFFGIGIGVIKATPVAAIIMLVWIFVGSASVPSAISVLMVIPIIWQNLVDGYNSISKELDEVATVFKLSRIRRFRIVVLPALLRFFIPATLTSVGFAWKAGVAAEIIAVAKSSIGAYIKDNKEYFYSDKMLAWTLTVVAISLLFEFGIKLLIKRYKVYEHQT